MSIEKTIYIYIVLYSVARVSTTSWGGAARFSTTGEVTMAASFARHRTVKNTPRSAYRLNIYYIERYENGDRKTVNNVRNNSPDVETTGRRARATGAKSENGLRTRYFINRYTGHAIRPTAWNRKTTINEITDGGRASTYGFAYDTRRCCYQTCSERECRKRT